MRCLIALLAACLALAAMADARALIHQVGDAAAARCPRRRCPLAFCCRHSAGLVRGLQPSRQLQALPFMLDDALSSSSFFPPPAQSGRRSLLQTLDRASTCAAIASDPDLSAMADAIRPGCALLQSTQAQQMLPQMASSMGFSTADVNVVLSCICGGHRRRALAGASTQLTPALVAQLVSQHPELQSMVDSIRPFCGLLSSVDVAGMLAGQGFSPADVQALLAYICG